MSDETNPDTLSEVMAELAEAEAAETQARAEAARARDRAAELRIAELEAVDPEADGAIEGEAGPPSRVRRLTVGRIAALALIGLLLASSVVMLVQVQKGHAQRTRDARYVAAASEGVTALLSIDYNHAKADVDRLLDLSTGAFKENFMKGAEDFIAGAEKSKSITKGEVTGAALESMDGNNGVVMLAATSQVTASSAGPQERRPWRMNVTVSEDGGRLKMSNVEFVP